MSIEAKPQLPVGEGGKLNRLANKQWRERLVELAPVKNKVIWVNPNFSNLPFNLQQDRESPLGLFAKEKALYSPGERKGSQTGELWVKHNRSLLLSRILFSDVSKHVYRDVDLKGTGLVVINFDFMTPQGSAYVDSENLMTPRRIGGDLTGLLDIKSAEYSRDRGEDFNALGIGTSRTLAIIKLSEIILNGQPVLVKTLKDNGKMPKSFHPVIEVRAFTNKARICDITSLWDVQARESFLCDAKAMASQKLRLVGGMSDEEYFMWLAGTIGRNVGLMHKNGWAHGFLNAHNLTLDGSIVDLDSVTSLAEPEDRRGDLNDVYYAVASSMGYTADNPEFRKYSSQLNNSYESIFSPKEQNGLF